MTDREEDLQDSEYANASSRSEEKSGFEFGVKAKSFSLFKWHLFILLVAAICAFAFQWALKSEIFTVPKEISASRKEFFLALGRYQNNQDYWDAKLRQYLGNIRTLSQNGQNEIIYNLVSDASSEIFVSFLVSELKISPAQLERVVIFPRNGENGFEIILSKYEAKAWLLKILVSMEVKIVLNEKGLNLEIKRLRRGAQDLATNLGLSYFGSEFEAIKRFEIFSSPSSLPIAHE
jgi:hypothetical protein